MDNSVLTPPLDAGTILQNKRKIKRKVIENNKEFIEKKIAILSGSTVGEIADILEIFLLNYGIKPVFWIGSYNRFYEDAVFNTGELIEFKPDIVYIHTSNKNIRFFPDPESSKERVSELLNAEIQQFFEVWEVISNKLNCVIIQNNFEMPPYRPFGNSEVYRQDGMLFYINQLNDLIYDYASNHSGFYVCDIAYEASVYGLHRWFDNAIWYAYKYPFALEAIPQVAYNLANIIKSIFGKNKRSLVLDLDNTLWGGVIGDCGADNILIGNDTPEGMAYSDFQKYIKRISEIGVNLSICSKNDPQNAMQGFLHPNSVLHKDDFICSYINWENKDDNIKKIASDINTSYENMVFLDDNPAERELVSNSIQQLCVPDLNLPEKYVETLDSYGFFEVTSISDDDMKRNEYYKNNQKRSSEIKSYATYEEYLLSLNMVCSIHDISVENIERVTQLINKTNQFNLTTKRYTQNEVQSFINDDTQIAFCASLADKFGSNGIVSVLFAEKRDTRAFINLWVMSCRVFNRNLEYAMFHELLQRCAEAGITEIHGEYYPTVKNKYVEQLYEKLNFTLIEQDEHHSAWSLALPCTLDNTTLYMEVIRDGQD